MKISWAKMKVTNSNASIIFNRRIIFLLFRVIDNEYRAMDFLLNCVPFYYEHYDCLGVGFIAIGCFNGVKVYRLQCPFIYEDEIKVKNGRIFIV